MEEMRNEIQAKITKHKNFDFMFNLFPFTTKLRMHANIRFQIMSDCCWVFTIIMNEQSEDRKSMKLGENWKCDDDGGKK